MGRIMTLKNDMIGAECFNNPPPVGVNEEPKYLESYDYDECKRRVRSRHLEQMAKRYHELSQAGCGLDPFRRKATDAKG